MKGLPKRVALQLFGGIRKTNFRVTSRTRLRARDRCTSSTLSLVGTAGGGRSSLWATLEGPTDFVSAWWM